MVHRYVKRANDYKNALFFSLAIILLLSINCYVLINQSTVVPYIVEVDKIGKPTNIKPALGSDTFTKDMMQRCIQYAIGKGIENIRSVTVDRQLQASMVDSFASHLTEQSKGFIREWLVKHHPITRSETELVNVNLNGIPRPVSKESWRVEWTETTRNHAGETQKVVVYEATITVKVVPPLNDVMINRNHLGIYFTSISWGEVFNAN